MNQNMNQNAGGQQSAPQNTQQQSNPQKTTSPQNGQGTAQKTAAPAAPAGNKRNLLISGAVILVILVALFVAPKVRNTDKEAPVAAEEGTGLSDGCKPGYVFSETTGKPCSSQEGEVSGVTATATAALSRAAATEKYTGKMVRFSVNEKGECVATPATLNQQSGTTIMLDNDTDVRRTVIVGSKTYTISPRRYTLSWLNTGKGELSVMCDSKVVGKVTVQ